MNQLLKVLIGAAAAAIIIVGVSASYYYVVFLPNKGNASIELQREKFLADQAQKQETQSNAEVQRINQRTLLDGCLTDVGTVYTEYVRKLSLKSKECDQDTGGARMGCQEAYIEAFAENDAWLQQEKNNCFKQYPQ